MKYKTNIVLLFLFTTFVLSACGIVNSTGTTDTTPSPSQGETRVKFSGRANTIIKNKNESQYLKMTLDENEVVIAAMIEGSATEEFLAQLPFTITMVEHRERQKDGYLPFSLTKENLQDTVYEYEVGDIVYWHPSSNIGIFHGHDGQRIGDGIEVLAKLDAKGIETFASYPENVDVTFELDTDDSSSSFCSTYTQDEGQLNIPLNERQSFTVVNRKYCGRKISR